MNIYCVLDDVPGEEEEVKKKPCLPLRRKLRLREAKYLKQQPTGDILPTDPAHRNRLKKMIDEDDVL